MKSLLPLLCFTSFALPGQAALELPAIFSDHAVLQQDHTIPVWGWTEPNQKVTITIADQSVTATAGADGKFRADLPKLSATGPQTLTVTAGSETKTLNDILIGEVWLGSGQSNMAMTVNRALDYEKEQAAAKLPQIRMFTERSGPSNQPSDRPTGSWVICSPETVGGFSATAYFFGREIHRTLNVPVGLINSSVGGTPIESWIAPDVQRAEPALKDFFATQKKSDDTFDATKAKATYEKQLARWREQAKAAKAKGNQPPRQPRDPIVTRSRKGNVGGLFNGKIAPLIPYAIRGALWYQGEANSSGEKGKYYQHQLPLLVKDWRSRWGSEFPFAWVQLPNFSAKRGEGWMLVREAALKSVQTVPNSGMAVTIDIGEEKDIHPKNKQEVGRRLSLWALDKVYGKAKSIQPLPLKHEVKGGRIIVTMSSGDMLVKIDGPTAFTIAGADKQWHPATVEMKDNTLIFSSPDVPTPVAARYAWSEMPPVNIWTPQGLPVTPFRTDTW